MEDREEGGILIWEREWENRELMDASYEHLMSTVEVKALHEETTALLKETGLDELVADGSREYFQVLDSYKSMALNCPIALRCFSCRIGF